VHPFFPSLLLSTVSSRSMIIPFFFFFSSRPYLFFSLSRLACRKAAGRGSFLFSYRFFFFFFIGGLGVRQPGAFFFFHGELYPSGTTSHFLRGFFFFPRVAVNCSIAFFFFFPFSLLFVRRRSTDRRAPFFFPAAFLFSLSLAPSRLKTPAIFFSPSSLPRRRTKAFSSRFFFFSFLWYCDAGISIVQYPSFPSFLSRAGGWRRSRFYLFPFPMNTRSAGPFFFSPSRNVASVFFQVFFFLPPLFSPARDLRLSFCPLFLLCPGGPGDLPVRSFFFPSFPFLPPNAMEMTRFSQFLQDVLRIFFFFGFFLFFFFFFPFFLLRFSFLFPCGTNDCAHPPLGLAESHGAPSSLLSLHLTWRRDRRRPFFPAFLFFPPLFVVKTIPLMRIPFLFPLSFHAARREDRNLAFF